MNHAERNPKTAVNPSSGPCASATVRLSNVGIYGNSTGVSPQGGAVVSFGNNRIGGNGTNGAPTSTVPQQ